MAILKEAQDIFLLYFRQGYIKQMNYQVSQFLVFKDTTLRLFSHSVMYYEKKEGK